MGVVMLNGKQYNTILKGMSMDNYSTTEHIVGTWIDGRPIYEITLDVNTTLSSGENTFSVSLL